METLTVGAAVVEFKGRYLLLKRAEHKENPGMWEFPGGKLHAGETLQQCVEREIKEELDVTAQADKLMGCSERVVGDKLIQIFGLHTVLDNEPVQFKDHSEMRWVSFQDMSTIPLTAPDLGLLQLLQNQALREREIVSLDPFSFFKFYGTIYGLVGVFLGLVIFISPGYMGWEIPMGWKGVAAITFPFIHIIVGGVMGAAVAVFYNVLASVVGGLKIRI